MADTEIAHTTLGILGNIVSIFFFLSSAPTVVRIVRCKSSGGIAGNLYVFKLFNCMLWCLYGIPYVHPHDVWVVLTNSFGCAFASIYIVAYLCIATRREKIELIWKLCATLLSFTILVILLVLLSKSRWQRVLVVGVACSVVSSGMHITLLSQCKLAIRLRDGKFLHPVESSAGFLKGAIWTAYGLVNLDLFILIPNAIGVSIGVIQAIVVLLLLRDVADVSTKANKEVSIDEESSQTKNLEQVVNVEEITARDPNQTIGPVSTTSSGVSRASSLLGLPRQGSITSSVVVPIVLMDVGSPSLNDVQK